MSDILNKIMERKGQFTGFETVRPVKVKKGSPKLYKRSKFVARVGVVYDNIAKVIEGRKNGELPAENAGLPYGQWLDFPYTIIHNGEVSVRCTKAENSHGKTEFFDEFGNIVDKEDVKRYAYASEFSSNDSPVFNIKLANIVDVK